MRRGLGMMAENAELLERHGIDYAGAIERFGGNAALYERLACKYVNDPISKALRPPSGRAMPKPPITRRIR